MKKRNIIAILASCAAVISIFTACGNKEEGVTNPTVVGTDGKVYEEITEAVTDAEGEAVTDAQGETQVVVVTKPYTTKEAEKEKEKDKDKGKDKEKEEDNTQAPEENPANPGSADTTVAPGAADTTVAPLFPGLTEPTGETTTTAEDVTYAEFEEVKVQLDQSGRPQQSMKDKLFEASAQNKSLYMDCAIVTNDNQVFSSGVNMKFYIKDNKVAIDFPVGISKMRFAFDGKSTNIMLPGNYYYTLGEAQSSDFNTLEELGLWSMVSSDTMKYDKTTGDDKFLCEIYTDESGNTVKYYFDKKNFELKRMEIIAPDKSSTILKINGVSTTVDDSVFTVPKGYELLTEDNFESIAGSLGLV